MFETPGRYLAALMNWMNAEWFGSYALTIILFTICLKLVTLPVDITQRRHMLRMQEHQPQLQKIQERYKDNPQNLQKKMSEYKKKNGIKDISVGGCLMPIIMMIVFGIFLSGMNTWGSYKNMELYAITSRMETTEEKQAYFSTYHFGWINNIWMPDSGMSPIIQKYSAFNPRPKPDLDRLKQAQTDLITVEATITELRNDATKKDELKAAKEEKKELESTIKTETKTQKAFDSHWKRFSQLMTQDEINEIVNTTEEQYNTDMQFAQDMYNGRSNGWFILPVLSGLTMLLMQWITTKLNSNSNQQQPGGKSMMYIMTGMWFFFCLSSNAAFALYACISNIASLAVTLGINHKNLKNILPAKKDKQL